MFDTKLLVQIVLVVALAFMTIVIVLPGRGARGQAIRKIVILVAGIVGVVVVMFPDLSSRVANLLGIGRGVDLILYGAVIVGIGFAITFNLRMRRSERFVTILARRMAILEAERDGGAPRATDEAGQRTGERIDGDGAVPEDVERRSHTE